MMGCLCLRSWLEAAYSQLLEVCRTVREIDGNLEMHELSLTQPRFMPFGG